MGSFAKLVSTPEAWEAFKTKYNIPVEVEIEHCELGEWHEKRSTKVVVILIIAFIEGG